MSSVREIAEEWKARANAAGLYLGRDPWSAPPAEGSLLDVPETADSHAVKHVRTFNITHFTGMAGFGPGIIVVDPAAV
jgi:hypothetical protein